MADTGLVNRADLTDRQLEIVTKSTKLLGIDINDVSSVMLSNGYPEDINVNRVQGNYTTSIIPFYGETLNSREREQLKQIRLTENLSNFESLNGISNLLGLNRKPLDAVVSSTRYFIDNKTTKGFDPSQARLSSSGLVAGAEQTPSKGETTVKVKSANSDDTRVRITVPAGPLSSILLNGPVLQPLQPTNGVLFPYTPTITVNHTARYNSESLTHSNYYYNFYQSSAVEEISINGIFAAKNKTDASYVIAVQHFFRTVTKMFYGQDAEAGLPPPILRLDGHGDYQFSSVPVAITSFSVNLPDDVDYITVDGNNTRIPVMQTFSIGCMPLYSRKSISQEFGFRNFAAGKLLGTAQRGGFI